MNLCFLPETTISHIIVVYSFGDWSLLNIIYYVDYHGKGKIHLVLAFSLPCTHFVTREPFHCCLFSLQFCQMGTSYNFCFLTRFYEFGFWKISSLSLWVYMFPMLALLLELANEHLSFSWCCQCHSFGVTKRKKLSK